MIPPFVFPHPSVVCDSGYFPAIEVISMWILAVIAFLFCKCVGPLLKAVGF